MKKAAIAIALIAAAAVAVYAGYEKKNHPVKYRTARVERGTIKSTITATGAVNPVKSVMVGTQVSGTIKSIMVDFNSSVKKGEMLAEIDPTQFEAQVEQARANLLSARANVEKAEATLHDTKRTLDRSVGLFDAGVASKSELDTARTNHESALAQLSGAIAQIAQNEATVRYAETNLQNTRILSPVNGTVVSRNVDVGQTVAASFQTPTLFTIANDLKKMQIDANVNEADIGKVLVGQAVDFTVDAYPETTFSGEVSQVRIAPTVVQNVVTYDVVVRVENERLALKPGMTANVSIISSVKQDVLKAPNVALRFRPEEPDEKSPPTPAYEGHGVWILDRDKPKRITVKIGISDGNHTEIVSGGLKEGQELIVETLQKGKKDASSHRMF